MCSGSCSADSQALKADALDFLGDGFITFLGLLAISWTLAWRARSALIQGIFLGLLGLGVLAMTGYRVLVLNHSDSELMSIFGAIALACAPSGCSRVMMLLATRPWWRRPGSSGGRTRPGPTWGWPL